ncbi:MAG: aminotransferase class I/II-fold pyridoxal phosphate-dependent enzyme [Chloroflexi bacterium]|nr:aminotransferase class I/II-fold pyridoxal phosphate-dependent enzyme [Chloroflexota bacterium]
MRNFISNRVTAVPPSGIRKYFDIAATMKGVISLGIGEPDFVTPAPILEAGIASLRRGETGYTSNSGTMDLRRAVATHYERLYGVSYGPDDEILITVGVSEAMYLIFTSILDTGDEVIVPQPSFVAYTAEVMLAGGVPVPIATRVENDFMVTGAEIEACITPRTKAILIGYPSNPTGAVMSRERLLEVARIAEKHDLLVISDEIYDRLVYGVAHTCFSSLPGMRERTMVLGGFSKDYAMTGWRIGYMLGPVDLVAAARKVHQYTIMSAPTTGQVAAVVALEQGEEYVERMRLEYDRRRKLIVSGLNSLSLDCFEPRGAFYAFPSIRKSGMNEEQFCDALLQEEQVACIPGSAFGAGGEGFVRMAYATSYEKIERALERMQRFMQRHG